MKILLIRFSSIGDIVLTTPVIRCLKTQIPQAEIHYLTKPQYASLLGSNPYIDKLHFLKDSLYDTVNELDKYHFDQVIDLHHNIRTFLIKNMLRIKHYAFYKLNIQKWLFVHLKINRLPQVHIVDRYLETVTHLGIQNDGKGLDYFIPEHDQINIAQQFPQVGTQPYIALVIGAKHYTKQLPIPKLINICRMIQQPILLLGGPDEQQKGDTIVKNTDGMIINTCGQFNLNQSASIVQQAWKVITHDTGLMHIAAAFNKPILSVWGNTIPAFGMTPYLPSDSTVQNERFEVPNLSCRPCSKIGKSKCPQKHFRCMDLQDENDIVDRLNIQS